MMDKGKMMASHVKRALKHIEEHGFPNKTSQDWQLKFHIQNWPQWVKDLSPIETIGFEMKPEWSKALISAFGEDSDNSLLGEIGNKIDSMGMTDYFIRLGSRSPKDSYGIMDTLKQTDGYMSVCIMTQSERVYVDLRSYETAGIKPWIFLRKWRDDIQQLNEFRCYVIDGDLAGVSQYLYCTDEDASVPIELCKKLILEFWAENKERWNKDIGDGVFDVWIHEGKLNLLEINPPNVSDPCLFRNGFTREVKYVNTSIPLDNVLTKSAIQDTNK